MARFLIALAGLAFATLCAQTPAGLVSLPAETVRPGADRDWEKLYVPTSEFRFLERTHRERGVISANHVAYKSQDLAMLGLLATPPIKMSKEDPEEAETIYPAIVIAHGSQRGVTRPFREIAYEFARRGYVVMVPSLRGQAGIEGRSQGAKEYAKGEVLDLLQAAQLVRKLPYVNSLRMGLIGFDHGASITMQAVSRSNIFQLAVAVSPVLFSGAPQFEFAGIHRLRSVYLSEYGRDLTEWQLMRELRLRDSFRNLKTFRTPLLLLSTSGDAAYQDQRRYVDLLQEAGKEARMITYGDVNPGFLTGVDDGSRSGSWAQTRDVAWNTIFQYVEGRIPGGAEELEEEEAE